MDNSQSSTQKIRTYTVTFYRHVSTDSIGKNFVIFVHKFLPNESLGIMSIIGKLPFKKHMQKDEIDIAYSFKSTYRLIREKLVEKN